MGGRRSRHWCGPGSFRETKKALARGFIGWWSAPTFFCNKKKERKKRNAKRNKPDPNLIRRSRAKSHTRTRFAIYRADANNCRVFIRVHSCPFVAHISSQR